VSIFAGTDAIINRRLFANTSNQYQQITALRILCGNDLHCTDAASLVREMFECMEETWRGSTRRLSKQPSKENWRFTQETEIDVKNSSREKQVEKRIAQLALAGKLETNRWANQVPVASGLLGAHTDKKACVDLAFRQGTHSFDLFELKMSSGAGHPLYAVIEVLRYGLIYLFSRRHARELGYVVGGAGLLAAERIRLAVLGPCSYFRETPPLWLNAFCEALTAGLAAELNRDGPEGLVMEIDAEQFPAWFVWPCSDEDLVRALLGRQPVCT
jgi:hypothetical protein